MNVVDIEDVYREDKELKREHVQQLNEWIAKQPHLPRFTELQLARFLTSCDYNSEFAKTTIENYATMRTYFPEISRNRNLASIQRTIDTMLMCLLPAKTREGYHVTLYRFLDADPTKYDCQEHYKKMDMMCSIWSAMIATSRGEVAIIDSAGSSMAHFAKTDFSIVKRHTLYVQDALPIRLKAIHMINSNAIVDRSLALLRPFLKSDMLSMIKTHRKLETLFEFVPQECLPNEYGGKAGSCMELHELEKRRLHDFADYLKDEEKLIVDETKRVGKSKDVSEVFGIEGTFKKLDID